MVISSGERHGAAYLTVVVPCYNEAETIGAQLDALASQTCPRSWEVVVADNGSTDATVEVARSYSDRLPGFRLVDASDRDGAAHARNRAVEASESDNLAFCDADDVVAPDWLPVIVEALEEHRFVASRHEVERLNPEWALAGRGRGQEDGLLTVWYPPHLPHATTTGLAVRRELFEEVGGFDESLLYLEDTDFCWRLIKRGCELQFVEDAVIHLRYRSTLVEMFRQARNWAYYNTLLYLRHRPPGASLSRPWRRYLRKWWQILKGCRDLASPSGRARLVWRAGQQIGLTGASLRFRVPPVV